MDATALGRRLGVTPMAVRLHLYDLEGEGLVTFREEARPRGRPAKLWRLTPDANKFFPDGHAQLTVSLIRSMNAAFGPKGMEKLLSARGEETAAEYELRLPKRASLRGRAEALAEIRSDEGYMAEIIEGEDGSLLLIERHCPICEAASECQGLCAMELDVFKKVLGPNVHVERTEHIQAGAQRCAYRITRRKPGAGRKKP